MAKPDITPGGGATEKSVAKKASDSDPERTAFLTYIANLTKRAVGGDGAAQTELRIQNEALSAIVAGLPPASGGEGLQLPPTAVPASGQPTPQS